MLKTPMHLSGSVRPGGVGFNASRIDKIGQLGIFCTGPYQCFQLSTFNRQIIQTAPTYYAVAWKGLKLDCDAKYCLFKHALKMNIGQL